MINVLLFAGLAEKAGKQQIIIQKEQTTVDEIKIELQEVYGVDAAQNVMVAVNEIYTREMLKCVAGTLLHSFLL